MKILQTEYFGYDKGDDCRYHVIKSGCKTYLANIYRKLKVEGRTELMAKLMVPEERI